MTENHSLEAQVAAQLRELEIATIAIIDDAFDAPRPSEEMYQGLVAALNDERGREIISRIVGIDVEDLDPDQLNTHTLLEQLWRCAIDESAEREETLGRLFAEQLDRRAPLDHMAQKLLALDVVRVQRLSPSDQAELHDAQIWFFDLFWKIDDTEDAWKISAKIARAQFGNRHMDPPICFLMSSDGARLEELQTAFRDEACCPAGYFKAFDKAHLEETDPEFSFMRWLKDSLDEKKVRFRRIVMGLARAMLQAAQGAVDHYKATLRGLAPEDYAHIYRFALKQEGAPLGTYMLWLFEPLFENYLRCDDHVHGYRSRLDVLGDADVPWFEITEHIPSFRLSEVHRARIWEAVPRENPKRLYQGELLSGHGKKWLVLNANCDLAYSEHDETRPQKDVSLLLLPGQVTPFSIEGVGAHVTEFYQETQETRGGGLQILHIRWDFGSANSVSYQNYATHYERLGYRLRSPHIAEIVQEWTNRVARFGTPVSPPIIRRVLVLELWWRKNSDEDWNRINPVHPHGVFIFSSAKIQQIAFADASKLADEIRELIVGRVPANILNSQVAELRKMPEGLTITKSLVKITKTFGVSIGNQTHAGSNYTLLLITEPITTYGTHD